MAYRIFLRFLICEYFVKVKKISKFQVVHAHSAPFMTKIRPKIKFFKFFLAFHNPHTSDYMHAKFRQNWTILIFEVHSALNCLKTKKSPILTKFGVHIVWIRLIIKSKKQIEKNYFSDKFLSWTVHCARYQSEILIFFSRFQNIYMWGILKILEVAQDMFNLLSKSENEGICYAHVRCARTKNILAN